MDDSSSRHRTLPLSRRRPSGPRGRSVPTIYGIVSLVMVVGAVTFALSTPPPTTPPLASVAPAPQEQLEVERVAQSSQFGEGAGGEGDCVPGDVGATGCDPRSGTAEHAPPEPSGTDGADGDGAAPVHEGRPASYHRCVSGPGGLRQTEDPQSPPCVTQRFPLGGDNGGATAVGVTADTIRVVLPFAVVNEHGTSGDEEIVRAFEAHFNARYEFHGRRLAVEFDYADGSVRDPETARAFARQVAERAPFAALDTSTNVSVFFETLAAAGVVTTSGDESFPLLGLTDPARHGPYLWSVFPTVPISLRTVGDLACTALVGRPARHAGGELATQERQLGLLVQTYRGVRIDPAALEARLAACGHTPATYDAGDEEPATLDGVVARMQADGVTTVVCVCYRLETDFTKAAERAGFAPEWLLPYDDHVTLGETSTGTTDHPSAQLARTFGITPKLRRPGRTTGDTAQDHSEQYWFTALREQAPELDVPPSGADRLYGHYAQLLVLASGIQHAGPELTPERFAEALHGLRFPNPGVGQAPWFQPRVGFAPADHVFNSDWALFWFEGTATPGASGSVSGRVDKGRLCYVASGARFGPGQWPKDVDEALFDAQEGCR